GAADRRRLAKQLSTEAGRFSDGPASLGPEAVRPGAGQTLAQTFAQRAQTILERAPRQFWRHPARRHDSIIGSRYRPGHDSAVTLRHGATMSSDLLRDVLFRPTARP